MGMLCKHVIWVLKHKNIRRIPDKYILNRWTKNALMKPVFDKHGNKMEDVGKSDNKKGMTNELWEEMYSCVSLAEENEKDIQMLIDKLREVKMEIKQHRSNEPPILNTMSEMERYVGCSIPKEINIQVPQKSRNKRSGKRIQSSVLKALEKSGKKQRVCQTCGKKGHNSRTCSKKVEESDSQDEDSEDED
ncbi:uncharacterized protein LOC141632511 [Silene latifolia]|uniref:uncharacterized protein LOC141632511 n=1 Tax=Silene latifolia TaxID=37657 RepID=UPI003D77E7E3